MLKKIRSYFMKFKGLQSLPERYFFPVVLLLYPFFGITKGLDIVDTTYNLGNYEFMGNVDPMWLFSTFLSNLFGNIIMKFPGAGTILGFSVYCTFIISAMALASYYVLQKWMPGRMVFIGEIIAESLCWAPRVILYHYLPYLLVTVGTLLLIRGVFSQKKQGILLFAAGVCLGLNVLMRFPAILDCVLILVLWFNSFIAKDKFADVAKKTGICIGGYAAGFGVPLFLISLKYGFNAYPDAISKLFAMTGEATDYSSGGMIADILEAYTHTLGNMLIMIPCLAAGTVMFLVVKEKYILLKKILYIAGLLLLAVYYVKKDVFSRNYYYYESMFQAVMMFLIITVILTILGTSGFLEDGVEERTISFAALMLILILPIGSNNRTMPLVNCLFLVAPIGLWIIQRFLQRFVDNERIFALRAMVTGVIVVLLVQGAIFHARFSFADHNEATPELKLDTKVTDIKKANGLMTTKANYDTLSELKNCIESNGLTQGKVLTFGNVPGISYLFDIEPAIDTTWPDLDSYSTVRFASALEKLDLSDNPNPTVVIGKLDDIMSANPNVTEKNNMLLDYIKKHDYNIIFESNRFTVYAVESEE
ncbi:MAG: hypothetical protein K6A61_06505 [Butyrivibrio sp.]|nr:hypothetical protein [Butyrivibrio sp.]